MTITVIDSPNSALVAREANALYMAGVRVAILYISPGFPAGDKTVKAPHIKAIHTAGLSVGFVCEWWGGSDNFAHGDIDASHGTRDGRVCGDYLKSLGSPAGTSIYPTVDNDVNSIQLKNLCLPYFRNFRAALDPQYRMGAYGCGALLFALEAENPKIMDFPWLSNALGWNRSREYLATGHAAITQQRETKMLGIDIDPDVLNPNMTDFGFWAP